MMRTSIITGVIAAFVVLSAPSASAEKLTLACTFESGGSDSRKNINQVIFDTDRPQVDLRVAQTMGTDTPYNFLYENNAARKDSIQMSLSVQRSALLLSTPVTRSSLASTGPPDG
ncbi:hypothetical protein [Bradyrhizobium sp.]|uniref:hypothetical protein n=1 Tax=Bradyrhizobium sp. TaxID=376 RepID=UPI003BAFB300